MAEKEDLCFVSPDGERLIVLRAFARLPDDWARAPVVELYERGTSALKIPAGVLVHDGDRLRLSPKRFFWLAGVLGVPGAPPRLTADGASVALTMIDGAERTVAFDKAAIDPVLVLAPHAAPAPAAPAANSDSADGFFTWEDEEGSVHFATSAADVPAKFRNRAKQTEGGDVGVFKGAGPMPRPSQRTVENDGPGAQGPSDSEAQAEFDAVCRGLTVEECRARIPAGSDLGRRVGAQADANAQERALADARRKKKEDEEGWARQRQAAQQAWLKQFGPPPSEVLSDQTTPMCGTSGKPACP